MVRTGCRAPATRLSSVAALATTAAISTIWLGAAAWASPGPSVSATGALELSSADGVGCRIGLEAADSELRLRCSVPPSGSGDPAEAGFSLTLPYLLVGSARPVGLAAFVEAPAAAAVTLLGRSGAPLETAWPLSAARAGAAVGRDFGAYAELPALDGASAGEWAAYGAWLAPRGFPLSALACVADTAAEPGGPGWYDPPVPAGRRAFGALGASFAGTGWALAVAAAAGLGFPGRDAAAGRAEARLSVAGLRLEAIASCAGPSWVDLGGGSAPFVRADLSLRRARAGLAWSLGWRYLRPDAYSADGAASALRASCDLAAWPGLVGVRALVGLADADGADGSVVELDARYRPAPAPWLSLRSSWRAADGAAERFDLGAAISVGERFPLELESGLRFVPEGRLYKAGLSLGVSGDRASVRLRAGSDGWVPEGSSLPESIEGSIRLTARLP